MTKCGTFHKVFSRGEQWVSKSVPVLCCVALWEQGSVVTSITCQR